MLRIAPDDIKFRADFESGAIKPEQFSHREHVRLAYIYLCESNLATAHARTRDAIQSLLQRNNIAAAKYHETLTLAWLKAVRYFMSKTADAESAAQFIELNPRLLDTKIMLTHYSPETLFSEEARAMFIDPDIEPIP
jgi:hypothetical protein